MFQFPFGGRCAANLLARGHHAQTEMLFQVAHDGFLSLEVVRVADHLAVQRDPVHQDVDVRMRCVGVAADDVLVVHKPHAPHPSVGNFSPLVISQAFVWMDANAHMADRFPESGAHGAHGPEFSREGAGCRSSHVGF